MTQRILVVDDEADICRIITRILAKYDTKTANSVDEALALLDANEFDLIISDIKMPGKSGIDLLNIVQQRELPIPFIFISGHLHVDDGLTLEKLQAIAFACLSKPFRVANLLNIVKEAIASYSR